MPFEIMPEFPPHRVIQCNGYFSKIFHRIYLNVVVL